MILSAPRDGRSIIHGFISSIGFFDPQPDAPNTVQMAAITWLRAAY